VCLKNEELVMKKCNACDEEFEKTFSFCPVDEMPLGQVSEHDGPQSFRLTLIEDAHLMGRLTIEVSFLLKRAREAWPSFKKDPLTFTKSQLGELRKHFKRAIARPYALPGMATAFAAVLLLILGLGVLDRRISKTAEISEADDLSLITTFHLPTEPAEDSDPGVGAGDKGRVGFERGKGEGSNPKPARAQGGGGGGTRDQNPPSLGKPPVASPIPAPIPTTYTRLRRALPEAGLDIDPALWRNLDHTSYGDPRSKSTTPSNGPGDGGGVGTNNGPGIGEGDGPGFGPGRDGNMGDGDNQRGSGDKGGSTGNDPDGDPDRVYRSPEVNSRPRVISKPEPQYTEDARRNQITGTVVLRVVFSRTGQVSNIQAVQKLGSGLTEKAIVAARQIQFVPATRNGQPVSMYMQLEYNFNLY